MNITFVTGNENKRREVAAILNMPDLKSTKMDLPEMQSTNLQEIVEGKIGAAYKWVCGPVIVEDVSFEVDALGGFPGTFVKFWEKLAGWDRALVLADHEKNARARARCGVGYKDAEHEFYVEGVVEGRIVTRAGEDGWGFDFYFIPEGYDQTYAEMGAAEKIKISHRFKGFTLMREKLASLGILL